MTDPLTKLLHQVLKDREPCSREDCTNRHYDYCIHEAEAMARRLDAAGVRAESDLILAAKELVRLGNQPGLDDDEWETAFTAVENALGPLLSIPDDAR